MLRPAVVRADATPLALRWEAPRGCPNRAEIESEVLHLVASKGSFSSTLVAEAKIVQQANRRYLLTLHTTQSGVDGERSFSGQSCHAVSDAAIVTMALSLDPNLELPKKFQTTLSEPVETHEAVAASPQTESPRTDLARTGLEQNRPIERPAKVTGPILNRLSLLPRASSQTQLAVQSILGWRWGALPESWGELGLSVGVSRKHVSAHLEVALSPSVTARSRTEPEVGGTFFLVTSALRGCWALSESQLRILPCAGMAVTYVSAEGIHVVPRQAKSLSFASPLFGLHASYPLAETVAFSVGISGYVPLRRPEASVLDGEVLLKPSPLMWRLGGGVIWRIW